MGSTVPVCPSDSPACILSLKGVVNGATESLNRVCKCARSQSKDLALRAFMNAEFVWQGL